MKDLIEKVVAEDKLLLQNGKLFEKPRAPGMPGAEMLDTPEISVVAVIGGKPVGDSNESRFSFKLNHTVCPIWLHLFQENLGDYPRALIENTTLSFDCSPNDLKAQFGKVKETIEKTNTDYKNFRGEVIVQFHEAQKRCAEDQKRREDRLKATQDALDKLEL